MDHEPAKRENILPPAVPGPLTVRDGDGAARETQQGYGSSGSLRILAGAGPFGRPEHAAIKPLRKAGLRAPRSPVFSRWLRAVLKRGLDIALSSVGLLCSLPLWGAIALAIKLEDGGPVLFVQERWGKSRRRFRVYKFRTMIDGADRAYGNIQATENDPRITRVGRLLRATAMDELPQILNIWKGHMSFVGPRALPINERQVNEANPELPDEAIPNFDIRCRVRPGLTGLAQIYAPRDVNRRNKFRYDALYVRRQSLWLDCRLICLSVWISLRGGWERRANRRGGATSAQKD